MLDTASSDKDRGRPRRSRWLPPGYLSVADLAATGLLSRASFYRIVGDELPVVRWRGRLLIDEKIFDAWRAAAPAQSPAASGDAGDREAVDG